MLKGLYRYTGLKGWTLGFLAVALMVSLALQIARPQVGPIEVIARRAASSKTFLNPNGSYTLQAYGGPVHYWDFNTNKWQDMNLSLRSQAVSEYSHIADGIPFQIRTGASAGSPVQIGQGSDYVTYRLQGALTAGALVNGNEVLYVNALLQTDVRYRVTNVGLKKYLRLKDATAPTTISFLIESNLQVSQAANGLAFIRSNGQQAFFLANPFAIDARGRRVDNMPYTVTPVAGRTLISFTVPVTGLTYPIEIDPQTTSYNGFAGDGYAGNSGTNWATVQTASVGNAANSTWSNAYVGSTWDGTNYTNDRMFMAFDTSNIPDNATISTDPTQLPTLRFNIGSLGTTFADPRMHVVTASQASVGQVTTSDYSAVGSTSMGYIDVGITSGYVQRTVTLSPTVLNARVNGIAKLGLLSNQDLNYLTTPTPSSDGYYSVNTAESGVTTQPVLTVTWTDVADPTVPPLTETGLGVPPNTSFYGSGNESTNLVNGNLVVSVPVVPGKPGRGVTLSMSAVYNHQI